MQGALPDPDAAASAKEAGALAFAAGRLDDALKSSTGQVAPHARSSSLSTEPQEVSDLAQIPVPEAEHNVVWDAAYFWVAGVAMLMG